MKKTILSLALMLTALVARAIPAQPNLWRTIQLKDGKTVYARLMGDEHLHYWEDKQQNTYLSTANGYEQTTALRLQTLRGQALTRLQQQAPAASKAPAAKGARRASSSVSYTGKKKGLIILVQFSDMKFQQADPVAYYRRVANEEGFSEGKFIGSVHDYFSQQSNGQFDLTFDVVGPYTLGTYASYGANDANGSDTNPQGMISAAVSSANAANIDFSPYDWNGDKEVEEVYVLYAGRGEATGGDANTVWPHKSQLSPALTTHDGYTVSVYACSNEMRTATLPEGIGTICHEFSHCLGFADLYDIYHNGSAGGNYGMGSWDLMSGGNHNGDGYCPAGYTAYEKMVAGWTDPVELTGNTTVTDLNSIADGGQAYIFYNPAAKNEYYMMENRKREGFDQKLPAAGLMVYHVDYDPTVWAYNCPNAYLTGVNDHERMTFIPADGLRTSDTETGDTWPYGNTSTLTSAQATCFNANTDGSKLMNISLSNIALSDDGLASFTFTNYNNSGTAEGFAFKETFDKCSGKGGNGSEGFMCGNALALRSWGASFTPDNGKNTDWDGYATAYGANQCLRAGGSSDSKVTVTTPKFTLNGTATLTFKASPFGLANKYDGTALTVSANGDGASLSQTSFTMTAGEWTTFTAELTAHGTVSLTFAPAGRFYLDEIAVPDPASTGIEAVASGTKRSDNIYRLDGTFAGTSVQSLPAGIYIRGGKKFVAK